MDEKEKSRGISRREFLKDAGLVVGGAAVGAAITYPLVPKAEEVVIKEVEVTKYKCPYCGATLATFDALKAHVTAQHPAEAIPEEVPKYVCPYCSAESDTFSALKAHVAAEHPPEVGVVEPAFEPEETVIRSVSAGGDPHDGTNVVKVDVKNGRIVRIRPIHWDEKYDPEEFNAWKLEARGKVFQPSMKDLVAPFGLAYKKRVYSPNRIKYPLKRVDWESGGVNVNPQNRGKSKFKRISWDEATDIIASEIKRIQETYGLEGILWGSSGHAETKCVHASRGVPVRLLGDGYTSISGTPDSWEGWAWGAQHCWGMDCPYTRVHSVGMMAPQTNLLKDVSENTDMILFQGCDLETTGWGIGGGAMTGVLYWYNELGIKCVYICPDLNYAAAVHADKWIPVLPNTDAALHLAISYIWMTEGTYDKDYVATHTFGFEKYEDYVLGKEDGIPKTPKWASERCGVPVWTIKALARAWAAKTTSIYHGLGGPMIRGPYSTEPARLEVYNLAMQGVGKPGRVQVENGAQRTWPRTIMDPSIEAAWRGRYGREKQFFQDTIFPDAILNPPVISRMFFLFGPVKQQFGEYRYPVEGASEVHMYWTDAPCFTTCRNDGNRYIEALRSPKLEFILTQQPWLENDSLYCDIILPVNTLFEEEDILVGGGDAIRTIFLEEKCIEGIGESMSDYEMVGEIAKKMGKYEEFTEGKTVEEWIRFGFDNSGVADLISWEEFKEKGYFVVPWAPDWKEDPVGIVKFVEDPEANPLNTKSGKIEFYGQWLVENFPDDEERGPVAKWVIGGPEAEGWTHDESLEGERCKKYPLLIVNNHPRWRMHAQHDDITWTREIPTCKVKGPDGYLYEPLWINPVDAEPRGIVSGDVVSIYNDRGTVLGGAYVTERIIPGAVYQDHGARCDPITDKLDRGGANNLITGKPTSKNALGLAVSGFLVEVEKTDLAELRTKYPEAFARDYDPAAGLRFNAWVEGGM